MLKLSTKRKFWNVRASLLDRQLASNAKSAFVGCELARLNRSLFCLFVCAMLLSLLIRAQEEARFQCLSQGQFDGTCDTFSLHLCVFARARAETERVRLGSNSIIFLCSLCWLYKNISNSASSVQTDESLVREITAVVRLFLFPSSSKPFCNVLGAKLSEGEKNKTHTPPPLIPCKQKSPLSSLQFGNLFFKDTIGERP